MQQTDVLDFIDNLEKTLSDNEKINQLVAAMGSATVPAEEFEELLAQNFNYKKADRTSPEYLQRHLISSLAKQAIAEAEIGFASGDHVSDRSMKNQPRYMHALNRLYGNEPEFQELLTKSAEERGAYYLKKLNNALDRFPQLENSYLSDQEIVDNYKVISELYNLLYELDSASSIIKTQENGSALLNHLKTLQSNIGALTSRAYLIASPYYAAIDYEQLLGLEMEKEALDELIPANDNGALEGHIKLFSAFRQSMSLTRETAISEKIQKENPQSINYFDLNLSTNPISHLDSLSCGKPLLAKVTGQDGTVSVRAYIPFPSQFSADMKAITPEEAFQLQPGIKAGEFSDLAFALTNADSSFKVSSDSFKNMQAAVDRLLSCNLSFNNAALSTQTMLGTHDALEELLETSSAYLQYKAQSYQARTSKQPDEAFRGVGKNQYEQSRIDAAVNLQKFARENLKLRNMLLEDPAFKERAAQREADLQKPASGKTRTQIAELREAFSHRYPESFQGASENIAALHRAVGRDLRRLAELASVDQRDLSAAEKADARTRLARVVTMDLIHNERGRSETAGKMENRINQNPAKFSATLAKSSQFQKLTEKLTPEKLRQLFSSEASLLPEGLVKQAQSVADKQKGPETTNNLQSPAKGAPQM